MEIIRVPKIMQDTCTTLRKRGRDIGAVFTMGALHAGHLSLIETARRENHTVITTIFVNPIQFGPGEDLAKYPRDPDGDIATLKQAGVDMLFMPDPVAMYPERFGALIDPGPIGTKLCGAFRPGHFSGVATVVTKLMHITAPTRAYFGLKDYQQVVVIERVVRDLNLPVDIVACPTMREQDGLAMSSRNRYLSGDERKAALAIPRALDAASNALCGGTTSMEGAGVIMRDALAAEPLITEIQYAGVYDAKTLEPVTAFNGHAVLAIAVKIGSTRLIDNKIVCAP